MLKWIVLVTSMWVTPSWAADIQELQLDDMRLSIPYAEFVKVRPQAAGQNNWYMYSPAPKDKKELGFPVRGYMRGFDSGRGCSAAIGFSKTAVTDQGGARFSYWEGPGAYASIDRYAKGGETFGVSLQMTLKTCPDSADQFKTRPPIK
ncbi:hypothetical protein [Massilia eburnea]|uniref:hypothetical protein n=1 Tax=Massilia eburnea TaxID=1776165 RepID=UPI003D6B1E1B